MNLTKILLLAFAGVAIAIVLVACNKKNAEQAASEASEPTPPVVEEPKEETPPKEKPYQVAGFSKTPCFGKCPVYEVKFFNDGTVTWDGRMNVEREGWYEAKVDETVLKEIRDKADSMGYFDLQNKYPTENQVADLPSTITMIRVGDMIKTVRNTHDAPDNLIKFEKYLLGVIEGLPWGFADK